MLLLPKQRILSQKYIVQQRIYESFETAVLDLFELYGNSTIEVSKISKGTNIMKNILGKTTIESFSFRTCVNPLLSKNELGQTKIVYESLTTKDEYQSLILSMRDKFCWLILFALIEIAEYNCLK